MIEEIQELLRECREARERGADFAAIWQEIIRPHRLCLGAPVQHHVEGRPLLAVRLVDGHSITFDGSKFTHRETLA